MRESLLLEFFEGTADAESLADGLQDVLGRQRPEPGRNVVVDIEADHRIELRHLIRLCEARLAGDLDSDDLKAAASFLLAAPHFTWEAGTAEGDLVSQVLRDWAAPERGYPLTTGNVTRFRDGLAQGRYPFPR